MFKVGDLVALIEKDVRHNREIISLARVTHIARSGVISMDNGLTAKRDGCIREKPKSWYSAPARIVPATYDHTEPLETREILTKQLQALVLSFPVKPSLPQASNAAIEKAIALLTGEIQP